METSSTSTISHGPRLWRPRFKLFEDAFHDPVPRLRQMNARDWDLATEASDGFHVDSVPPCSSQPMIFPPPRGAGRDPPPLEVRIGLDNTNFFSRQLCVDAAQVSYYAAVRPPVTLDRRTPQSADGSDLRSEPESEDEPGCRVRFEDDTNADAESEDIVECDSGHGESDSVGGDFSERGSDAGGSYLDFAEESEPDEFARNWGTAARAHSGEHDLDDGRQLPDGAASFFDGPHPWEEPRAE